MKMKTIERVRLSEIKPNEANPRADFGDISALADSIRATGGEPVNPIVCVRDENVLFIVDGERRYRALRELYGDEDPEISVTVVDGWREGNEVLAMLATDNKKRLSEAEMSRGYQLSFDLGTKYLTDTELAMATGVETDKVMHARLAWGRLGKAEREKYVQCSLDQFAAAQEFEGKDFDAVLRAKPESWRLKASNIRERIAARAVADRVADVCALVGIEWIEAGGAYKCEEGFALVKDLYRMDDDAIAALPDLIAECGATAMVWTPGWWQGAYHLIAPAKEQAKPEKTQEQIDRERAKEVQKELHEHILSFIAASAGTKAMRAWASGEHRGWALGRMRKMLEKHGMEPDRIEAALSEPASFYELCDALDGLGLWRVDDRAPAVLDAARSDGYEPTEAEEWLADYVRKSIDGDGDGE